MTQPRQHPLIWLALVATLALALLPTVSHGLAHARGGAAAWAEVCTPQGLRSVELAAAAPDGDDAPLPAPAPGEHCPLCPLAAHHPGLPPASVHIGVPLRFDAVRVSTADQAHRPLPVWRHAQPRGPPVAG